MDYFKELFDSLTSHGWLTIDEAQALFEYAKACSGDVLEVGSYGGRSAKVLGNALLGTDRKLHCVDPWDHCNDSPGGDEFIMGVFKESTLNLPVVTWRQKIEDWKPLSVEMAFLDGDHSYEGTAHQIEKALLCKPKVVMMHDFGDDAVKLASLRMLGAPKKIINRLAIWEL